MLRTHKLLSLAISSLLLAGMAIAANAQTETFGPQSITNPTDFSGSFFFTKFNPSLGTLNSVFLTLSNGFTTTVTVTNSSGAASSGHVNTELSAALFDSTTTMSTPGNTLTATGGIFNLISDGQTANQSYSLAAGGSTTLPTKSGTSNAASAPSFTDAPTLSFFTGASGTAQVNYLTFTQTNLGNSGGNTTSSQATTDTLSATVQYNYTPASTSTPEPGTWAMMVAGASTGLVALRRRRNKK